MFIRIWPHPDLNKVCPEVEHDDLEFTLQLEEMTKMMRQWGGIGLAANQVGIIKKMLVAVNEYGDVRQFVNPRIVGFAGEWKDMREGCLSIPNFVETTKRCTKVVVEFGAPAVNELSPIRIVEEFDGQLAHVLQHEIEHLEGKMFIDKLKPARKDALRAQLRKNRGGR